MKIRTDFVTNSSSSSFVAYNLRDSKFCKYLTEQMKKNDFTYEKYSDSRPASYVSVHSSSLSADISCQYEDLYCHHYAPEVCYKWEVYGGDEKDTDIRNMSEKILSLMHEFIPFEKVDDLDKLYDAFWTTSKTKDLNAMYIWVTPTKER